MKRTLALTVAGIVAAAPALGLIAAHASQSAPTVSANRAVVADDKGRHAEPGDDKGRHAEPGDDRGQHAEPGDDKGRHAQSRDDKGRHAEPGDDKGQHREAHHHHRHGGRH
jgi:hypothetical protein